MRQVKITKKMLETAATGTLTYWVCFNKDQKSMHSQEEPVEVLFEETSLTWRSEHGGPDTVINNEFLIPCLMQDLLHLVSTGWKITVGTFINDPK